MRMFRWMCDVHHSMTYRISHIHDVSHTSIYTSSSQHTPKIVHVSFFTGHVSLPCNIQLLTQLLYTFPRMSIEVLEKEPAAWTYSSHSVSWQSQPHQHHRLFFSTCLLTNRTDRLDQCPSRRQHPLSRHLWAKDFEDELDWNWNVLRHEYPFVHARLVKYLPVENLLHGRCVQCLSDTFYVFYTFFVKIWKEPLNYQLALTNLSPKIMNLIPL